MEAQMHTVQAIQSLLPCVYCGTVTQYFLVSNVLGKES